MPRMTLAALIAVFIFVVSSPVQAKHHHRHSARAAQSHTASRQSIILDVAARPAYVSNPTAHGPSSMPMGRRIIAPVRSRDFAEGRDPRPRAWCAWWLRRKLGIPKTAFPPYQYNLARAFARLGSPAQKGCVSCIGVFSRGRMGHVGIVEGWDANGNPVLLSGNFNGGVGTAPHPASRLIALRWIS